MTTTPPRDLTTYRDVLYAVADGYELQFRDCYGTWKDCDKDHPLKSIIDRKAIRYRVRPKEKTGWILIKPPSGGVRIDDTEGIFETEDQMRGYMEVSPHKDDYIAAIQITYREGDGL